MANICDYELFATGKLNDLKAFRAMMDQTGKKYIPSTKYESDFLIEKPEIVDGDIYRQHFAGGTRWSVQSGMLETHDDEDGITLVEASKLANVSIEVFSTEPGIGFAEHYEITPEDGIITSEVVPYKEIYLEDILEELGILYEKRLLPGARWRIKDYIEDEITKDICSSTLTNFLLENEYVSIGGFEPYSDFPTVRMPARKKYKTKKRTIIWHSSYKEDLPIDKDILFIRKGQSWIEQGFITNHGVIPVDNGYTGDASITLDDIDWFADASDAMPTLR